MKTDSRATMGATAPEAISCRFISSLSPKLVKLLLEVMDEGWSMANMSIFPDRWLSKHQQQVLSFTMIRRLWKWIYYLGVQNKTRQNATVSSVKKWHFNFPEKLGRATFSYCDRAIWREKLTSLRSIKHEAEKDVYLEEGTCQPIRNASLLCYCPRTTEIFPKPDFGYGILVPFPVSVCFY